MAVHKQIRSIWLGSSVLGVVLSLNTGMPHQVSGAADEAGMQSGGAQTPPGGGRSDSLRGPTMGSGNRGTAPQAGTATVDPSKVRSNPHAAGRVRGHVLAIEGDSYVIRDQEANELTVKKDRTTHIDGVISMGAQVEADVEPNGHLARIQRIP